MFPFHCKSCKNSKVSSKREILIHKCSIYVIKDLQYNGNTEENLSILCKGPTINEYKDLF